MRLEISSGERYISVHGGFTCFVVIVEAWFWA
jgi:hypothetical protein